MRRWTPEQVLAWTRTGEVPRPQAKPIPRQLRIDVWQRDGGICGICHEPADPLDWTCDHIMPQALNGPTVRDNLRVTHPRCNRGRTHPLKMSEGEITDAADEWTANELAIDAPSFG